MSPIDSRHGEVGCSQKIKRCIWCLNVRITLIVTGSFLLSRSWGKANNPRDLSSGSGSLHRTGIMATECPEKTRKRICSPALKSHGGCRCDLSDPDVGCLEAQLSVFFRGAIPWPDPDLRFGTISNGGETCFTQTRQDRVAYPELRLEGCVSSGQTPDERWSISSRLPTQNPIQRIRGLVNQRFGVVRIRVKVFKRQEPLVPRLGQSLGDGGPVGGAIE